MTQLKVTRWPARAFSRRCLARAGLNSRSAGVKLKAKGNGNDRRLHNIRGNPAAMVDRLHDRRIRPRSSGAVVVLLGKVAIAAGLWSIAGAFPAPRTQWVRPYRRIRND